MTVTAVLSRTMSRPGGPPQTPDETQARVNVNVLYLETSVSQKQINCALGDPQSKREVKSRLTFTPETL